MFQQLHQSVLLQEAVEALAVRSAGRYLDATFGRGGHARQILQNLGQDGRLTVVDRDVEALRFAQELASEDNRVEVIAGDFASVVDDLCQAEVLFDGVLFDFGVSSPQLDDAGRGFSFRQDGPLDMRMDNQSGETAAEWLNRASVEEMKKVFWRYGEERNAARVAREVVAMRADRPLLRTIELADLVERVIGSNHRSKKHPATKVFQAIRIFINDELKQIEQVLPNALRLLSQGGRLVLISFHSLEDRLVKRFIREMAKPENIDRRLPVVPDNMRPALLKPVGKAVKAVDYDANVRARSAVMRVAERL